MSLSCSLNSKGPPATPSVSSGSSCSQGGPSKPGYARDTVSSRHRFFRGGRSRASKREPSRPLYYQPPQDDSEGHLMVSPGELLVSRFRILSTLGEGTFGRVLRVWDLVAEEERALKVIKNVEKYRQAADLEVTALESLEACDLIVRCFDSFDYYGHRCLVFELLGSSVFELLRRRGYAPYPLCGIRAILHQVLSALRFMHGLRLAHTDLKPENILFRDEEASSGRVKLIDLGSATFEWEHHSGVVSTRHYRAPEVIVEAGWSYPVDVWSLGCISYELFTGNTLFQTHSNREHLALMSAVTLRPFPFSLSASCPKYFDASGTLKWDGGREEALRRPSVKPLREVICGPSREERQLLDLILKCLELDPKYRSRVESLLNHSFFDNNEETTNTIKALEPSLQKMSLFGR